MICKTGSFCSFVVLTTSVAAVLLCGCSNPTPPIPASVPPSSTPAAPVGLQHVNQRLDDPNFQSDALLAAYDMTTVQGSTLYDVSGNGNNGTINGGVTFDENGATFDGSTGYISIPALAGNKSFTMIAVVAGTQQALQQMWGESIPADDGATEILVNNWQDFFYRDASYNTAIADNSTSGYGSCCQFNAPNTFHAYLAQYDGANTCTQIMDIPDTFAFAPASSVNIGATTAGTIGAQQYGASSFRYYFKGTIAYLAIWRGTFPNCSAQSSANSLATPLQGVYNELQVAMQSRNVRLVPTGLRPQSAGPVLVRQGAVVTNGAEPTVIHDTANCQTTRAPCFRMWYTGFPGYELYAESPGTDGVNWTKVGPITMSDGVTTIPDGNQSQFKKDGTYYLYTSGTVPGQTGQTLYHQISVLTSRDGLKWKYAGQALACWGGSGPESGGCYNTSESYDPASGWKMLYDCSESYNTNWTTCYAYSSDGIHWTKSNLNPVMGAYGWLDALHGTNQPLCTATSISKVNGVYWVFGHNGSVPSDIYLCYWGDGTGYLAPDPATKFLARGTSPEESQIYSQVQDPSVVEANGKTYIYYDVNENGNGPSTYLNIKLAIANMPLQKLVTTTGGSTASTP